MSQVRLSIRADAHKWRARIDNGLVESEQQEFERWLDSDPRHFAAYADAESLWGKIGQTEVMGAIAEEFRSPAPDISSWDVHVESTHRWWAESAEIINASLARIVGGAVTIAACMAIFFAIDGPGLLDQIGTDSAQQFATSRGQTRTINLPDRSRIVLGAASQLELELSDDARTVRLQKGDAYFDVVSNAERPFTISTGLARVEVTGTQFDIRLHEDSMDVAVGEGKVRVSSRRAGDSGSSVELTAGQAIRTTTENGFGSIVEIFPAEFAAWRSGRLIYIRSPLSEVVEEINRYASQPIILGPKVGSIEFSGTFDADNIDGLLKSIDEGSPVELVRRADQIEIVRE
ncbi:MAG: FecR domain-containing protein [Pseudomonadota bacterium]